MATITGISGNLRVESVATLPWNQWQLSRGIGGNLGVEYAVILPDSIDAEEFRQLRVLLRWKWKATNGGT